MSQFMTPEIILLSTTAATVAFVHTLLGPDHYLPFVAMAKARGWSLAKTIKTTSLFGVGHITGSIIIGLVGVYAGIQLGEIEGLESTRGSFAAWALIAFGLVYMVWGIRKAYKGRLHTHGHLHGDVWHTHEHDHHEKHAHIHKKTDGVVAPLSLFFVFVLGPCEALIPILMYPAAKQSMGAVLIVTSIFSIVTVLTMLVIVVCSIWGLKDIKLPRLERFSHAFVGGTMLMCGCSITLLGL
jgi:sulfite exporter TauE/SafE